MSFQEEKDGNESDETVEQITDVDKAELVDYVYVPLSYKRQHGLKTRLVPLSADYEDYCTTNALEQLKAIEKNHMERVKIEELDTQNKRTVFNDTRDTMEESFEHRKASLKEERRVEDEQKSKKRAREDIAETYKRTLADTNALYGPGLSKPLEASTEFAF